MLTFEKYHQELNIPSDINELSSVEVFLDRLQQDLNLPDTIFANIVISVTEAVNNAIIHGNKNDISKNVYITAKLNNPYSLSLFVKDCGNGFDLNSIKDPTLMENIFSENGRGVFVMKHLTDELIYHDNGSLLELKFNI